MSDKHESDPLTRKVLTRQPGIMGAQWWNEGLKDMNDPMSRRQTIQALVALGVGVAVVGTVISAIDSPSSGDEAGDAVELFDALKMQHDFGWNFGAAEDALLYPELTGFVAPERLQNLVQELTPRQDALKPFHQATLFQSVDGNRLAKPTDLSHLLRIVQTPAMDKAFHQGLGLASLFAQQPEAALATAVLVDLPGPESVAFATAMAEHFEPVFTQDNWPHPLGVVPAHLTLSAVAYYQPLLVWLAPRRRVPAPPVFVLDRRRLEPYTDSEHQFDNRYTVRLPSAEQLRKLGIQHVLYVAPPGITQELDDLNEDLVAWRAAGLDVKWLAASDFRPDSLQTPPPGAAPAPASSVSDGGTPGTPDAGVFDGMALGVTAPEELRSSWLYGSHFPHLPSVLYRFGGTRATHDTFWALYPWRPRPAEPPRARGRSRTPPPVPSAPGPSGISPTGVLSYKEPEAGLLGLSGGHQYVPSKRPTMFSALPRGASGTPLPRPVNFGKVAMNVRSQPYAILGPRFISRSSWNRASTSSGG